MTRTNNQQGELFRQLALAMSSDERKRASEPSELAKRKTNRLKRKDLRNACMSKSQVFVCYSGSYFVARHNADLTLSVTERECVIRLLANGASLFS